MKHFYTHFSLLILIIGICFISCKKNKNTIIEITKENITTQDIKRVKPEVYPNQYSTPLNSEVKYHIIAASYSHAEKAKKLSSQLYKKGYPSRVLYKKGHYRVTLQSFTNKERAIRELFRLRKLNKKLDLWLLKQ